MSDSDTETLRAKEKYRFADVQSALAFIVTAGFFACVAVYLWRPPASDSSSLQMISLLIGGITAKFGDIVAYYFNATKVGKENNETISNIAKTMAGNTGNGNTNGDTTKLVVTPPTPGRTVVETKASVPTPGRSTRKPGGQN